MPLSEIATLEQWIRHVPKHPDTYRPRILYLRGGHVTSAVHALWYSVSRLAAVLSTRLFTEWCASGDHRTSRSLLKTGALECVHV
eukprot:6208887-Pleurochrysis_carterae.AAC.10